MMDVIEQIACIRKDFPDGMIWYYYTYNGLMVFAVSQYPHFTRLDYTIEHYIITKHGIEYFDSDAALDNDYDRYLDALANVTCVDITPEQLAMTRPY